MVSGTHTQKKTADEIPVEGNCWRFLQWASVWAAWGAPFPQFLSQQWKRRRADTGLFQIFPRAPPSAGGFPNFVFGADKIYILRSYRICFDYFFTFPQFIGRQWKWISADLGLFRIQPRAPSPASCFSKFIFVVENQQPSSQSGYCSSTRVFKNWACVFPFYFASYSWTLHICV